MFFIAHLIIFWGLFEWKCHHNNFILNVTTNIQLIKDSLSASWLSLYLGPLHVGSLILFFGYCGEGLDDTSISTMFKSHCRTREHWTGEVSEHEWVPIFPVFNQLLVIWKKYYVFEEMTLSSGYSCIACNNQKISVFLKFESQKKEKFSRIVKMDVTTGLEFSFEALSLKAHCGIPCTCIHLLHFILFSKVFYAGYLTLDDTKIWKCSAENACANGMWQPGLNQSCTC